jgi:hypothetical protein
MTLCLCNVLSENPQILDLNKILLSLKESVKSKPSDIDDALENILNNVDVNDPNYLLNAYQA